MPANARIVSESWADAVPITATSQASTDYAAANLQDEQPSRVWRSSTTATQLLDGSLPEDQQIGALVLYNHNLSVSATVRIELAQIQAAIGGPPGTDPAYYTATIAALEPTYGLGVAPLGLVPLGGYGSNPATQQNYTVHWIVPAVLARYYRITLTDPQNPDGYLSVGRLMLGEFFETSASIDWGNQFGNVDESTLQRTRGGALRSGSRNPYRRNTLQFSWLDIEDVNELETIVVKTGKRTSLLVAEYPDDTTSLGQLTVLFGRLIDWSPTSRQQTRYYKKSITIEEAL